ncbi:hypothetical protein GQ53DRAFT_748294 [Thozetella sp. PMI_491]|nr:hypothetical protein GQ53DRAFT_748294 [Thozetella sp. PMI_491]
MSLMLERALGAFGHPFGRRLARKSFASFQGHPLFLFSLFPRAPHTWQLSRSRLAQKDNSWWGQACSYLEKLGFDGGE